jgi:hypothetical protein
MGYRVIEMGNDPSHVCEDNLPGVYEYPQGTVVECECGQRWWINRFRLWDKTYYRTSAEG